MQETKVEPGHVPARGARRRRATTPSTTPRAAGRASRSPRRTASRSRTPRAGLDRRARRRRGALARGHAPARCASITTYVPERPRGRLAVLRGQAALPRRRGRAHPRAVGRRAGRRRGLQRLPGRPRRLRPGGVRRRHARHARRSASASPRCSTAGTVDAFRELHPDEPGFTWWDYRAGPLPQEAGAADRRRPALAAGRRAARRSAASTATSARARSPPTTRRCSSS